MKIVRLVDSEWYIKEYKIDVDDYSINLFKHINKHGKLIEKEIYFETESFKNFVIYLNEYGFKIIDENETKPTQTQVKRSVCYTC